MPSLREHNLRLLDFWIPASEELDEEELTRGRVLVAMLVYGTLVAAGMGVLRVSWGEWSAGGLVLVLLNPMLLCCLAALRWGVSVARVGDLFVLWTAGVLAMICVIDGGLTSRALVWFPVVALVANFLNGWLVRERLLILLSLILLVLLVGSRRGWLISAEAWPAANPAGRAAATFGATLLATILARFYDDVRDQARRQRAELERLRSEWVAVVSHELRTPLTAIRGSLGLIDAGALDDDPQQRREAIAIAHRNAKSLGRLVDELLDVERITSGELSLHLEEADAVQLAKGAVATFRELAAQREVGLELAAPAQLPLRADAGRLTQVLHNLISNALKFSPAGGTVHVAVTSGAERVRFSVRDGGPGISAEFAPRLFERFTQEDSSTERKTAGSGLGLYVSKAIVEQHGGQIGFENDPGGGCVFSVVLPLSLR